MVGLFDTNVVTEIFGSGTTSDVVYVIVGIAGIAMLPRLFEDLARWAAARTIPADGSDDGQGVHPAQQSRDRRSGSTAAHAGIAAAMEQGFRRSLRGCQRAVVIVFALGFTGAISSPSAPR